MNNTNPYAVIKLVCGETIFAKYSVMPDDVIRLTNPMVVKLVSGENEDVVNCSEWMPFVTGPHYYLPTKSILYVGPLSERYKSYYGMVLLKNEVEKMQEEAKSRVEQGENEVVVMHDLLDRMEVVCLEITGEFGIEGPDLDSLRKKYSEKLKYVLH